jgi:hypothetical protein
MNPRVGALIKTETTQSIDLKPNKQKNMKQSFRKPTDLSIYAKQFQV